MGGAMGKLSQLRKRTANRVHPDSSELEQPLIESAADTELAGVEDAAPSEPLLGVPKLQRRHAEHRELPFGLGAIARAVAAAWHCFIGLLQRLLPFHRQVAPQISLLEQDRLAGLRQRAAVPYNAEAEEHQAALQTLWRVAFGDELDFPVGIKHPKWKDMGWQGEDPGTDFRGAGFISLQALLWMAQRQPDTFFLLMHKAQGTRSGWEYPFAAGGVNVVYMLTDVLDLRQPGEAPLPPAVLSCRCWRTALMRLSSCL